MKETSASDSESSSDTVSGFDVSSLALAGVTTLDLPLPVGVEDFFAIRSSTNDILSSSLHGMHAKDKLEFQKRKRTRGYQERQKPGGGKLQFFSFPTRSIRTH
jgi:hypothetical protein